MKKRKVLSLFDIVLFVVLLTLSFLGLIFMKRLFPSGDSVVIEVGGELKGIYSLMEDRSIQIHGPIGDTEVEIKGGMVRIVDSPCQNKVCVRHGYISKGSIICLPNRVAITVGKTDAGFLAGPETFLGDTIDAVTSSQ